MNQPLGYAVGNALEVKEAIDTLRGEGPSDLEELCLDLGSRMLVLADKAETADEAKGILRQLIQSGAALETFKRFVEAQGGDPSVIDHPEKLPQARQQLPLAVEEDGFVSYINAESVGLAAMMLGAGRETKDSAIDLAVGIVLQKKIGDSVKKGEALGVLHVNDEARLPDAAALLREAFEISPTPSARPPLLYGVVTSEGIDRFF
jgi:pyrimidine-nucleoside phosphorylase